MDFTSFPHIFPKPTKSINSILFGKNHVVEFGEKKDSSSDIKYFKEELFSTSIRAFWKDGRYDVGSIEMLRSLKVFNTIVHNYFVEKD